MSLADEVAELRRRVADMVRRGVVDEVIRVAAVMVRVDIGDVLSPPLPWIQVQSGRYMQVSNYRLRRCRYSDIGGGRFA